MRFFDGLFPAVIFCSSLVFAWHLGGSLIAPKAVEINAILMSVFSVGFGLWWYYQPESHRFHPISLIFVPWLLWLLLDRFCFSPEPLLAGVRLCAWTQGAVLFAMLIHLGGHSRRLLLRILVAAVAGSAVAVVFAASQASMRQGWIPGGFAQPEWVKGKASGPFLLPADLASMLLLLLPLCASVAAMRSFAGGVRIVAFVISIMFAATLVMTLDTHSLWIAGALLLLLPLLVAGYNRRRLLTLAAEALCLLLLAGLLGLSRDVVRDRYAERASVVDPVAWTHAQGQAWQVFKANPLKGGGYGASALPATGELSFNANPVQTDARGQYLQELSAHGMAAILLFAPFACCLIIGWRKWSQLSFYKFSRNEAFRNRPHNINNDGPGNRPGANDPRLYNHSAPTTKVLLGGVMAGLTTFGAAMIFASPFENAALVCLFMLMAAAGVVLVQPDFKDIGGRYAGIAGLSAALLLVALLEPAAILWSRAQLYVYDAQTTLAAEQDPNAPVRSLLRTRYSALNAIELSLELVPDNPVAIAMSARICNELSLLLPQDSELLRTKAKARIAKAIEMQPRNWYYQAIRAEGLRTAGSAAAEVEAGYRKATDLEPGSAMAWTMYADYLSTLENRRDDATKALDRALALIPGFTPALRVKSRLDIGLVR